MAAIDKPALIEKALLFLPDGNILSDELMILLMDQIVDQVGDDTENEPEILCKYLKAVATVNESLSKVDAAPIQSEKAKNYSVSYNTALSTDAWRDYIKSLKNVCPIFGYIPPSSGIGVKVVSKEDTFTVFTECGC